MTKWKQLLSALVAALMLLTMPLTTGIAGALADGTEGQPELPAGVVELETEELDPATLHVQKLGEVEEAEEEAGEFDPENATYTDLNRTVRVSIFLDGASTVERGYGTRGIAQNKSAVAYRDSLRQQQLAMQKTIESEIGHPLTVKWNLTLLVNAISVEIPYKEISMIARIPGVKSVELETLYSAPQPVEDGPNTANTSANMVGAVNAWYQLGYTGAGSRVAIIDTGLDVDHQSVNAEAFDYAIETLREEGREIELMGQVTPEVAAQLNSKSTNFISTKIPYAYNYVDGGTRINHIDRQSNHGSHVAGIAAANRFIKSGDEFVDAAETVKAVGMAPDAQILVMKVFGSGGGAYDSDYFAAIEDALVLEADAANLSLGSSAPGFTYASTTYQTVLNGLVQNTVDNHMILSISAGNAYAADDFSSHKLYAEDVNFHTGGSPGTFLNSLGVAAAQNTLTEGTPLIFNGNVQVFYAEDTEGDGGSYGNPVITTIAGTHEFVYIDSVGNVSDYSTVNEAVSLADKILIVNRGALSFYEKGNNAKSFNPKAVIIANNAEGVIHMDITGYTGTFPMVSILLKDAEAIKASSEQAEVGGITYYTGSVEVTTEHVATVTPRGEAEITAFSSWGVPGSLIMKPEITAPGGDIYSINGTSNASSDTNTGTTSYVSYSGTSMAAPHITGLSAVLMQYFRENPPANEELTGKYDLRAIAQSLLMSTATPLVNNNAYLSILQQGAGLVDVSDAIESRTVIMMDDAYLTSATNAAADGKVKVELGDDPERTGSYEYKFTLYNLSDETLSFELDTDLFTQAIINGDTLAHTTELLPWEGVTYDWNGTVVRDNVYDVDRDGDTDDADAQAILDYLTGERDGSELDLAAADVDGDGAVTTYDAHLLLNYEQIGFDGDFLLEPHGSAQVTVRINLTDDQKAVFEARECGGYIEGFTYVTCTDSSAEGESFRHEHSIPILGYYGSWTDPTMFDTNSYTEQLYGNTQINFSGVAAANTNYMQVTTNGTTAQFSGNPYMVEEEFPTERLAIRSDATIVSFRYNLVRDAGGTAFAITKLDEAGKNERVVASAVVGTNVSGLWYNDDSGAWQNTASRTYTLNKALNAYNGLNEGDRVRVGFYAIPEYNAMQHSTDMTASSAGTLTDAKLSSILLGNELGKGAMIGFDLTIDDTAPEVTSAVLEGSTLSITASDDRALAYVAVLSLDGTVKYAEKAPGTDTFTLTLDATDIIENANAYIAAFAGDYAGNEAAVAVRVNDNTTAQKTVYVLTDTLEANNDYLIVNANAVGNAYILRRNNTSVATTRVKINAGVEQTENAVYIDGADVASTAVWSATDGIRFRNGNYYLRRNSNTGSNLQISTNNTYNTWQYADNRLRFADRATYMRYYNNTFSLTTNANSATDIYLFVKTTMTYEVAPYDVSAVEVVPMTVSLYKDTSATLIAQVTPLTASDREVIWTSDNESIATVDENGKVTGVAAGTTTVRATAHSDETKFGEATVTVIAANKNLNGIIWDEEAGVYFSSFNSDTLPTWNKLHENDQELALQSAFMNNASTLYAGSLDMDSQTSYLYTVDRSNYDLTELGENYVMAFDAARASTSYSGYYVYAFANYLVFGNIEAEEDEEDGGIYCGIPYGLLDASTRIGDDVYIVAVAARTVGTTSSSFYFLDENGKIWQTTMNIRNSISFGNPTQVVDTGISTSFLYQTLYYDGTFLYWGHQDGDVSELIIINPSNGAIYHVGDFGQDIWPAVGFYVDGAAAPAAVDDEPASDEPLELKALASRDELMTAEVRARIAAEAKKFGAGSAVKLQAEAGTNVEASHLRASASAPAVHRLSTNLNVGASKAAAAAVEEGTVTVCDTEPTLNGLFTLTYDPDELTYQSHTTGTEFVSVHKDDSGVITVAYAVKGSEPIAAETALATVTFTSQNCVESEVAVRTAERNDAFGLTEEQTVEIAGIGHDWDEPTYEWADDFSTVTATRVCKTDATHVETETVSATYAVVTEPQAYVEGLGRWTSAAFENPAFAVQTKDVVIPMLLVTFVGGEMNALDSYVIEDGEKLYCFDVSVINLPNGEFAVDSMQIFLTYDQELLAFRKAEGVADWSVSESGTVLSMAWASEEDVTLKDGDVVVTLYFAAVDEIAPGTRAEIAFTESVHGNVSALSYAEEDTVKELTALTVDGSILFEGPFMGDANCDGMITAADAAIILRALVNLSELTPRGAANADVNGDGEVTAADAAAILRYVVGLIKTLPVE